MNIVITGCSSGIGSELVKILTKSHKVYGLSRNSYKLDKLKSSLNKPKNFHFYPGDVVTINTKIINEWITDSHVDLLINNAAIINQPAPVWKIDSEEFSQLIDINIKGVANVIRHFVPAMISRGSGIIVNISSGWGRSTSPQVGPYCASKWAIEGLTRALSQELPSGIAAIPLNPGIIHTDMLDICFGEDAKSFTPIESWTKKAVPFLLNLKVQDNGIPLTIS